jgi:tripartite-type tricarboxylate transporter receptor subunit TctC
MTLLLRFALCAFALLFPFAVAHAQYPDHPIRLVVPFAVGEADVVARLVSQAMKDELGQSVVVENKPGAAGNIAAAFVAKSPPDGYTLFAGFSNVFVTNPSMYKSLPFDPDKDFALISLVAESQFMLVARASLPVSTVKELIEYAKANPGKLTFSSGGIGSPLHLAGELFMTRAGVKLLHVPYKGGQDAARAVLTGEVDLLFGALSSSISNVQAGKVKAIASTGPTRYAILPDLPTISESGLPGYEVTAWHSIEAPAGTPEPILQVLRNAVHKAIASPEVKSKLEAIGLTPKGSTGEELARRIQAERTLWSGVIKGAGIKPE